MRGAAKILVMVAALGCGPKPAPAPAPTPVPTPEPEPVADEPSPDPAISLVTSMVVVEACPESKMLDSKAATREIEELVGPCKRVPGGAAHFSATLLPGGRVELAAPSGNTNDGIVPTCLLKQQKQLKHKLRLKKACKFDVKLEQRIAEKP